MPFAPQPIFPTIIATGQLENYKKYRPLFKKAFEEDKAREEGTVENTLSDKLIHSYSPNDHDEDGLNASLGIKNNLKEFVKELTKEVSRFAYWNYGINNERCEWFCNVAWLNEMEDGGFQYRHNHTNSFLSVVYFIDLPKDSPITMLHRPSLDLRSTMSFEPDRYHDGNFEYVVPSMEEDTFLIFPSYLQHEVPLMKTGTSEKRRTFACNFIPTQVDTSSYILRFKK
jgi:uncharacterized protein (TIGR02466 family)